jgi:hypothetical protein
MADEFDRKIMPDFLQTTLTLSLGAAYKSVEMMRTPAESASKMVSEMKSLITIPEDAPAGIQEKAKALAGVWMGKGMDLMTECKAAGEKFTEGK